MSHYGKYAPSKQQIIVSKLKPEVLAKGGKLNVVKESFRSECTECPLFKESLRIRPDIQGKGGALLVGEAPGRNERTAPFQGEAGDFLRAVLDLDPENSVQVRSLTGHGVSMKGMYSLANTVNCRPFTDEGANRPPTEKEIAQCKSQLWQTIAEVNPKVIVCFGNTAISTLLPNVSGGIMSIRGRFFESPFGVPVMPIVHPAAPLHSGSQTQVDQICSDLTKVSKFLHGDESVLDEEEFDISVLATVGEIEAYADFIEGEDIAYDVETSPGTDPFEEGQRLLCISFTHKKRSARVIVLDHPQSDCNVFQLSKDIEDMIDAQKTAFEEKNWELVQEYQEKIEASREELLINRDLLEQKMAASLKVLKQAKRIIAHNAKFEFQMTKLFFNYEMEDELHCSLLIRKAVDPLAKEYGLKPIGAGLGYVEWDAELHNFLKALPKGTRKTFDKVPLGILVPYNAMDTIVSYDTFMRDECRAKKTGTWKLYSEHLQAAGVEFGHIAWNGLQLDEEKWKIAAEFYHGKLRECLEKLYMHPDMLAYHVQRMRIVLEKIPIKDGDETVGHFVSQPGHDQYNYVADCDARFNPGSRIHLSDLLYKFLGWEMRGFGKAYPQKRILIGEGDGERTEFTLKGMMTRGKSTKIVDMDYTHDHSISVEKSGVIAPMIIDGVYNTIFKEGDFQKRQIRAGIPPNACRIIRYGDADSKDIVKFGTPPSKGTNIFASFVKKDPSSSADIFGDFDAFFRSGVSKYELAANFIALSNARKMYGTYVKPMMDKRSDDGLVHPQFNIHGTVTGRMSSGWHTIPWAERLKAMFSSKYRDGSATYRESKLLMDLLQRETDKLETLPESEEKKRKESQKIIDTIRAVKGGVVMCADEAQIEIRVGTAFSREPKLLKIFRDGLLKPENPEDWKIIESDYGKPGQSREEIIKYWSIWTDPHRVVAAKSLRKEIELVTESERRFSKMTHFGIFYLRSAKSTANSLFDHFKKDKVKCDGRIASVPYPPGHIFWLECNGDRMKDSITRSVRVTDTFKLDLGFDPGDDEITLVYRPHYDNLVSFCQEMIDGYYAEYDHVRDWQLRQMEICNERGYITCPTGRRVPLPTEVSKWDAKVRSVNYPIQGTSSDIVAFALVVIARVLRANSKYLDLVGNAAQKVGRQDIIALVEEIGRRGRLKSHFFGSVHDSALLDSPIDEIDLAVPIARFVLEYTGFHQPWLCCPLKADVGVGPNWGSQVELDEKYFVAKGAAISRSGTVISLS